MKNQSIALAGLIAIISTAASSGVSLKIVPFPNAIVHSGQKVHLEFNASGFAPGANAQIGLFSARSPYTDGEFVWTDIPVQNGLNKLDLEIPWSDIEREYPPNGNERGPSWGRTGPFQIRVVIGGLKWTDNRVLTIRSAIIWPYPGTVYPKNQGVWVTWTTSDGGYDPVPFHWYEIYLSDEGGSYFEKVEFTSPYWGRAYFVTPNVSGDRFRISLVTIWQHNDAGSEVTGSISSGLISIR